jgi:hypothetical protein
MAVSISLAAGIVIGASGYAVVERLAGRRVAATDLIESSVSTTGRAAGSSQYGTSPDPTRPVAPPVVELETVAAVRPETEPQRSAVAQRDPRIESQSATERGSLEIVSRPSGAQVTLDGRVVGQTPLSLADIPGGPHDVVLELPGYSRWATSVVVAAGNTRVGASLESQAAQ